MQLERRFNLIDGKFGEEITAQDGHIGPFCAQSAGSDAKEYSATVGQPAVAMMCIGPVSLPTAPAAPRAKPQFQQSSSRRSGHGLPHRRNRRSPSHVHPHPHRSGQASRLVRRARAPTRYRTRPASVSRDDAPNHPAPARHRVLPDRSGRHPRRPNQGRCRHVRSPPSATARPDDQPCACHRASCWHGDERQSAQFPTIRARPRAT